jgi:hypothetical protein
MADQSSPHFPMLKIHRNGPCRHMYLDSRAGPNCSRGCEALGSQVHSGVGRKLKATSPLQTRGLMGTTVIIIVIYF